MRDVPPGDFEPDESVLDAMQAWGAPPEEIDQVREQLAASAARAPGGGEAFQVHADNWQTVGAFLALRTQWGYAGMEAQRIGLDYQAVCAWVEQHVARPRRRRPLLRGIQVMEHAVLQADHERKEKEE